MLNKIGKRLTIILLSVGGGLLALGFIINMIVLGINGFDINKAYGTKENMHEEKIIGEIKEINIDVAEADINIYEANDGSSGRVVFLDSYNIYHTLSVNNGILRIERKSKTGWMQIFVPSFLSKMSIDIYLPKVDEYNNIQINSVSGDLKINTSLNSKGIALSMTSGDISINELKGDLGVKNVSGDIFINSSAGGSINLETVSGGIDIMDSSYNSTRAKSVSGDIRLNGEFKNNLNAEAVSGDIILECKNPIEVSANTRGNITLPSNNSGEAKARLKSVSGNIRAGLI